MGADLLLYICNVPGVLGDEFKKACKPFVDEMSDRDVYSFFEDVTYDLEEYTDDIADSLGLPDDQEPTEEQLLAGLRTRLWILLNEACEYLELGGRDVGVVKLGGVEYFMSGGMSWGDEPTDACQYIHKLSYTGADMVGHEPDDLQREGPHDYKLVGESAWVTVANLSVYIRAGEDGVAVDVYAKDVEDSDEAHLTGTWAFYSEGVAYECGNCGTEIEADAVRRNRKGDLFCPDCGSNDVAVMRPEEE